MKDGAMRPPAYPSTDQQSEASDTLGRLRNVNLQPAHLYHKPSTSTTRSKQSTASTAVASNQNPRGHAHGASVDSTGPSVVTKPKASARWSMSSSLGRGRERDRERHRQQPSNATFYTEDDTPPPSPSASDMRTVSDFRSNASQHRPLAPADLGYHSKPTARLDETYDYRYDHVAPPAPLPTRDDSICGFKRRSFLISMGLLLLVIIGVAVGVGVGVGMGGNRGSQDASTSPTGTKTSSASTATDTSTASSTGTATSSSSAPTTTSTVCPAANNTIYTEPASKKKFLRLCGIDYAGADGTEDIFMVKTDSMINCIINCVGTPGCTACSWGAFEGDTEDNHRCYLKRNLKKPSPRRAGWDFAILQ